MAYTYCTRVQTSTAKLSGRCGRHNKVGHVIWRGKPNFWILWLEINPVIVFLTVSNVNMAKRI